MISFTLVAMTFGIIIPIYIVYAYFYNKWYYKDYIETYNDFVKLMKNEKYIYKKFIYRTL